MKGNVLFRPFFCNYTLNSHKGDLFAVLSNTEKMEAFFVNNMNPIGIKERPPLMNIMMLRKMRVL